MRVPGQRVKHLNPRQGITTNRLQDGVRSRMSAQIGVKHLNPRQGITTGSVSFWLASNHSNLCETPKSPPGDYNVVSDPGTPLARIGTFV